MPTGIVRLGRTSPLQGSLRVPGDKSITHRLIMLGGVSRGNTRIRGWLRSEDCLSTLAAMQALGVTVVEQDGDLVLQGRAGCLSSPVGPLDMGNSVPSPLPGSEGQILLSC